MVYHRIARDRTGDLLSCPGAHSSPLLAREPVRSGSFSDSYDLAHTHPAPGKLQLLTQESSFRCLTLKPSRRSEPLSLSFLVPMPGPDPDLAFSSRMASVPDVHTLLAPALSLTPTAVGPSYPQEALPPQSSQLWSGVLQTLEGRP